MTRLTGPAAALAVVVLRYLYAARGFPFFDDGDFNVNLLGVRAAGRQADRYDDAIVAAWKEGGAWIVLVVRATTDPGVPWMAAPMNPKGAARVAPGFYRGLWRVGQRSDGRPAFVQVGAVDVQRDNDRDAVYDEAAPKERGVFAILLHGPSGGPSVGRSSAGCQVPATAPGFEAVYAAGVAQRDRRGWSTLSYALFDARADPLAGALIAAAT